MELGIAGKVAIVGGASMGLGSGCAESLAREGVKVTIVARREEALQQTAEALRAKYQADVTSVAADLSQPDDIARVVGATIDEHGGIDILVHNTGGPPPGGFFDQDEQSWETAFNLILMSAVRMYHHVIPHMREKGWGRIVNITSAYVKEPIDTIILSNVFRIGLVSMTRTLSKELAPDGITINNVGPGPFRTARVEQLIAARSEETGQSVDQLIAETVAGIPVGRMGESIEIGDLVAFLASDLAGYMTGTTIQSDGGSFKGVF